MKPLATNIADVETLRKVGFLYVDKTAHQHRLITTPGSTFFFLRTAEALREVAERDDAEVEKIQ